MEYNEEEGKIGKGPLQLPIFLKNSHGSLIQQLSWYVSAYLLQGRIG